MTLHPLNKIKLAGTILGVIALALVVGIKAPDYAKASANNNVHGYLWSDMPTDSETNTSSGNLSAGRGFGYISMNSDDPGMSGSYGVSIDSATGELSGQAYSEWNEWLDFDAAGPFPPYNAATSAKVMPSCWAQQQSNPALWCNVIGWARFNGGMDPQSGGWDGWVSLNSDIPPVYHVAYQKSTGNFQGKAWGGTDTGWIDFDHVTSTSPQSLSCADPLTGTVYTYTDPLNPPAQCGPIAGMSICYSEPGHVGHFYPTGSTPPSICTPPPPNTCTDSTAYNFGLPLPCTYDFCPDSLIPKVQSYTTMANGFQYNGTWYGLSAGVCTASVCSNHSGFYATPPAGEVALPDGTCGVLHSWCADHPTAPQCQAGPIKPIYKEN